MFRRNAHIEYSKEANEKQYRPDAPMPEPTRSFYRGFHYYAKRYPFFAPYIEDDSFVRNHLLPELRKAYQRMKNTAPCGIGKQKYSGAMLWRDCWEQNGANSYDISPIHDVMRHALYDIEVRLPEDM